MNEDLQEYDPKGIFMWTSSESMFQSLSCHNDNSAFAVSLELKFSSNWRRIFFWFL